MNFFIGIDQTGAVSPRGIPRALPLAFLDAREPTPVLRTLALDGRPLSLPTFSQDSLEAVLVENAVENAHNLVRSNETALLVDAVFGLPQQMQLPAPRELFVRAALAGRAYGLKPAAEFFDQLYTEFMAGPAAPSAQDSASEQRPVRYPVRECETLAKANSVFRTHPFQKNIQCGTYRIWRDLGLYGSEWLHLRYFEKAKRDAPVLYEAYPSAVWREVFDLRTRDRTQLKAKFKKPSTKKKLAHPPEAAPKFPGLHSVEIATEDLELMIEDADHADAGVLALGGFLLQEQLKIKRSKDKRLSSEGWILGLDPRLRKKP